MVLDRYWESYIINNIMAEQDKTIMYVGDNSWNSISWKNVDRDVSRIRRRIFRASKEKDSKRLRRLQRLAVKSYSVILHSVRKVTQKSSGKNTPGFDKKTYLTGSARMKLADDIRNMDIKLWKPNVIMRRYIPKPDGRQRPLGIPTIKDRVIQAMVVCALEPEWEAKFEPASYGFRPGKSYQDAVHRIFTLLSKKNRVWVLDADIKGCFDNIDHGFLLDRLKDFPYADLIRKWLKAGILDNGSYYNSTVGTPQGGVVSPLLCNIALHGLEADLGIKYGSAGYVSRRNNPLGRTLVRYADDFIVICPTKEIAEQTMMDVSSALSRRGLSLNMDKTKIVHSFLGFDFLGFNFIHRLKYGYKHVNLGDISSGIHPSFMKYVSTIVTPSGKSLKSICAKLSEVFAKHRGKSAAQLISTLNPIIRGYGESKRTWSFSHGAARIDHHLYKLQMRWIKRKHPKKSVSWCVKRYFIRYVTARVNSKWTFRDPVFGRVCYKAIWYGTARNWPPVVSSYCPDDPNPEIREYWKSRINSLLASRVVDLFSNGDYWLARSQHSLCPVCEQSLFNEDPIHRHHILPTAMGGKNTLGNLVLVHIQCHHHVHYGPDSIAVWIDRLKAYKDSRTMDRTEKNLTFTEPAD